MRARAGARSRDRAAMGEAGGAEEPRRVSAEARVGAEARAAAREFALLPSAPPRSAGSAWALLGGSGRPRTSSAGSVARAGGGGRRLRLRKRGGRGMGGGRAPVPLRRPPGGPPPPHGPEAGGAGGARVGANRPPQRELPSGRALELRSGRSQPPGPSPGGLRVRGRVVSPGLGAQGEGPFLLGSLVLAPRRALPACSLAFGNGASLALTKWLGGPVVAQRKPSRLITARLRSVPGRAQWVKEPAL